MDENNVINNELRPEDSTESRDLVVDDSILVDDEVTEVLEQAEESDPESEVEIIEKQSYANLLQFEIIEINDDDDELPEANPVFKCAYCNLRFVRRRERANHIQKDHRGFPANYRRGRPIRCKFCRTQNIFPGVASLQDHIDQVHPLYERKKSVAKPKCKVCGQVWPTENALLKHMISHIPEKFFQCHVCFKHFKRSEGLIRHMQTKHGAHQLQCPDCFEDFKSKEEIAKHRIIHTVPPFKCERCQKTWKTREGLLHHYGTQHASRSKRKVYSCSICFKRFTTAPGWKRHITNHAKGSSNECPICHKKVRGKFIKHLRVHDTLARRSGGAKGKIVKLENDKKTFVMETFKCLECPMNFTQENRLKRHMICSHSGEFICPTCGEIFIGKYSLKQHDLQHTRLSLLECLFCTQTFMKESLLIRHQTLVHKIAKENAVVIPASAENGLIKVKKEIFNESTEEELFPLDHLEIQHDVDTEKPSDEQTKESNEITQADNRNSQEENMERIHEISKELTDLTDENTKEKEPDQLLAFDGEMISNQEKENAQAVVNNLVEEEKSNEVFPSHLLDMIHDLDAEMIADEAMENDIISQVELENSHDRINEITNEFSVEANIRGEQEELLSSEGLFAPN